MIGAAAPGGRESRRMAVVRPDGPGYNEEGFGGGPVLNAEDDA
jgi:hypothetical protein